MKPTIFDFLRKLVTKDKRKIAEIKSKIAIEKKEDKFFELLDKIHKSHNRVEKFYMIKDAKALAKDIPRLSSWPKSSIFWDLEAQRWNSNIQENVREFLKKEIIKIAGKDSRNICLGSGSAVYLPNSVLVDYSEEMLRLAPKSFEKLAFNLDNKKKLPFKNSSFDSCTMVFLTNYIKNLDSLFKEACRLLKKNGVAIIVNYEGFTSELFAEQEQNHLLGKDLCKMLSKCGFKAETFKKSFGNLSFIFVIAKRRK